MVGRALPYLPHLVAILHEALAMLRMACSMRLSQRALLRIPRRCTQQDLRRNRPFREAWTSAPTSTKR